MRRFRVSAVAIAVLVAMTLPAAATSPSGVSIEVETSLAGASSPFVASGPAVEAGLICSEGVVVDPSGKVNGFSPTGFNFQGIKQFICEDGSGDIFVNLQARIDFRRGVTFNWNVVGGTGDYASLHGAGRGVGLDLCGPDCVFDVYDGGIHIDP